MKPGFEKLTRRGFAQTMAAGVALAQGPAQSQAARATIAKAMDAIRAATATAEADPSRPVYHFHPPAQWNNDPNGTIFYRRWHHLFYQVNPYGATWGHMHWGHARSRDMVNWEHLPVALWPSLEKGEEHVFSGAAVLAAGGLPRLFYTSIGKREPEQWMAAPVDDELIVWEKYAANPILTQKIHGDRKVEDWRDPFLFQEGGRTYMVCGGNHDRRRRGGAGQVELYEATKADLTAWKYRGTVFEYRDSSVYNIECPNLFRLGAKWVLLISPEPSHATEYFLGSLDLERGKFTPETHGVLDPGPSYASNISRDGQGRTILWLWGKTETDPAMGWNGCMTMPRILGIDGEGFLRQNPAPEFETLRGAARSVEPVELSEKPVAVDAGECLEVQATLSAKTASAVGLRVGGKTEILYDARGGVLVAGGAKKVIGTMQPLRLRVFLDRRVMEVYANDGQAAIFTTVDGAGGDRKIEAFARGGAGRLEECRVWPMKAALMTLDRFKV
jgi:beta-fructofuranosidase